MSAVPERAFGIQETFYAKDATDKKKRKEGKKRKT